MGSNPSSNPLHNPLHAFGWMTKLLGSSVVLLVLVVLGTVGVATFFGHKLVAHQERTDRTLEMVVSNLRVINEQTIVREIVEEKLQKLTADQRARVAFELYDGCRRRGIPIHYAMAVIECESRWDCGVRSSAGAIGLCQIMPDTGIAYFRAKGIPFTIEKLYDPVTNVAIAMDILGDKQDIAVMLGKSNREDWVQALWYYSGKGESYARQVISNSVVFKKRLDAPLQGKVENATSKVEPVATKTPA